MYSFSFGVVHINFHGEPFAHCMLMEDMGTVSDVLKLPGLAWLQVKMTTDLSQYVMPNDTPVAVLDCTEAFAGLTDREKLYAHYLAQASFAGGLIVLVQVGTPTLLYLSLCVCVCVCGWGGGGVGGD